LRLFWEAWKAYAHRAGSYQSRVLLNVAYFAVFGPSALLARAFGAHLLDLRTDKRASYWRTREATPSTLEALERQF
jgi:hypothetical protein